MIKLTTKATNKLLEIRSEDEDLVKSLLRINVIGSGCAGFSFDLYFDNQEPSDNDVVYEINGIKFVINQFCALYLEGTEIDYVDSLFGAGFKFNNSTFSSKCACGSSFQF